MPNPTRRTRATDLAPAQWKIMKDLVDRGLAAEPQDIPKWIRQLPDGTWDHFTDLANRGLIFFTDGIPGRPPGLPCKVYATTAGKTLTDVVLNPLLAVLLSCYSRGVDIPKVRDLAGDWTLLGELFERGLLELRAGEHGQTVHRPSWEELFEFSHRSLCLGIHVHATNKAAPFTRGI